MLRPLSLLPLALLFAVSCSDSIDKPAARGKKSGSVAPGAGNAADGSSEADTTSPKRVVAARRLNNREYAATVRDLLGTSLNPADNFPADPIGLNFDNVGASLSVSPVLGKLFYSSAEALAGEIKGPKVQALTGCTDLTETCLQNFVATFGLKAWRRPLSAEEVASIMSLSKAQSTGTLEGFAQFTVMQLLVSPYFLFRCVFLADFAQSRTRTRPSKLRNIG